MHPSSRPRQLVLRSEAIGRELSAIGAVRREVDSFLEGEGIAHARDDVLLVLSELLTNSLIHTERPPAVVVRHDDGRIDIEVSDHSTTLPEPRVPDEGAQGGRGLIIVGRIASAWGVRPADDGKTTWASVEVARPSS